MREPKADKSARALEIVRRLGEAFPEATTALDFGSPLELMVAVVLSAQCTDARVNKVTPELFARFKTVEDFARARRPTLAKYIKSCGLYRNKAKGIIGACK